MENEGLNLLDLIFKGGIIMLPIGLLSLLSIYFIIERAIYITQANKLESNFIANLRDMLSKRVIRLQGLVELREAQRAYEEKYGSLIALSELVSKGLVESLPTDPLGLGYELREQRIELRKLDIAGLEEQP